MRIVHLSDMHLSYDNFNEFQNHYLNALIRDLKTYHENENKIDLIVITGDLIDQGGDTLYKIRDLEINFKNKYGIDLDENTNPYIIFEKLFIEQIAKELQLTNKNFLFIPGNHDVDDSKITLKEENYLIEELNDSNSRKFLNENEQNFYHSRRIEKFKLFEEQFHFNTINYKFSKNQSTYIYESNKVKYGFILLNDSWRCKQKKYTLVAENGVSSIFLGAQQIIDGVNDLENKGSNINICLMHHSIANFKDKESINSAFLSKDIQLILYGHYHESKVENILSQKTLMKIRCRASLNKTNEKDWSYIPGYLIIDLSGNKLDKIHYRYYNFKHKKFQLDNENGHDDGVDDNKGDGYVLKVSENINLGNLNENDFFKNY